jgi:hypothetical protein
MLSFPLLRYIATENEANFSPELLPCELCRALYLGAELSAHSIANLRTPGLLNGGCTFLAQRTTSAFSAPSAKPLAARIPAKNDAY